MIKARKHFFLSLFGHLLLYLSFLLVFNYQNEIIYKPNLKTVSASLPAYIYHEHVSRVQKTATKKMMAPLKKVPISIFGFKKQEQMEQNTAQFAPANQLKPAIQSPHRLNMKSDETIDAPLLRILSEATAAKLIYPQVAAAFNQRGTVKIRFFIYPNGNISEIVLLASSGFDPLDKAALNAINAISPVRNVDLYLKKPRHITAYIEFR